MKLHTSNPQDIILSAVRQYIAYVSPTYGPAGKGVLIHSPAGVKLVDDGQMATRELELTNELENAVLDYIKEASEKTNSRVGDGTTTAAILMGALVEKVIGDTSYSLTQGIYEDKVRELRIGLSEAVKEISKQAKKIKSKEELYSIAYNSYNNETYAKLVSEVIFAVGRDGVVSIEDSQTMESSSEIVDGLELSKGFFSPYLASPGAESIQMKNPKVILLNDKIERFNDFVPLVKPLIDKGNKEFLVIGSGFGDDAVSGIILNMMRGAFSVLLVETPGFGDQKRDNLNDIAAITGASVYDLKVGGEIMPGSVSIVTAYKDKTVLVGAGAPKSAISAYVDSLKTQEEKASKYDKERIQKRIAQITGGVALIKVGANTENEQTTIKAKVTDALSATKTAFRSGIVRGGGKTYADIQTSSPLLNEILKAPREQLEKNGKEYLNDEVYDPAEVLIAALESAVSIGIGLITMGSIVAYKRKEEKETQY